MPAGIGLYSPTQIRIPPTLKEKVKTKADSEGRTLTSVVIEALETYVKGTGNHGAIRPDTED